MAEIWRQGISSLQEAYMKQAAGQSLGPEGFLFGGIDPGAFKAWTELYERETLNQFRMPPMGLTREHEERHEPGDGGLQPVSVGHDPVPVPDLPPHGEVAPGDAGGAFRRTVKGEMPAEEFKALYRKWVGVLEEKYMVLLKSKEYIEAMNKAIDAFGEFKSAKSQWMEHYLKMMDVPTQREMDDVCKDLYNLKKEVKELRKALENR